MESIILSLFDYIRNINFQQNFAQILAALFYSAYIFFVIFYYRKRKRQRRGGERDFLLLEQTLVSESNITPTAGLLQAVFCGMRKKTELDSSDKIDLSVYLFEYIKVHPKEYNKIYPLIEDIKKADPYAGVPAEERRIILELSRQIQNLPDTQSILEQIDYIATLIAKREQVVEQLNGKSTKYAKIGMAFTILFGVFTLIQLIMMLIPLAK